MQRRRSSALPLRRGLRRRGWLRHATAAVVIGVVLWRFGTGPFTHGLARVDAVSLATGVAVAVVTTTCCAWRWTLVARGLGVAVPLRTAVAAYYRSQFLNLTTPGGVLGDVDRAVAHGRAVGDHARSLRSVVWERCAGQVVLVAASVVALALLPSPVRHAVRGLLLSSGAVCVLAVVALQVLRRRGTPLPAAAARHGGTVGVARLSAELRSVVLARPTRSRILLASSVAACGHVVTFLVAARAAGAAAAPIRVLPLALVVLLAMGLPNVAGWGPREGVAAWAFGAGGLGPDLGITTTVVYGVMVLVGALPGALLLLAAGSRRALGAARG